MDKIIVCKSCGIPFELTEGEKAYYRSRHFVPPCHCAECRVQRRKDPYADWKMTMYQPLPVHRGPRHSYYVRRI